jgi:hypothetical protein
MVKENLRMSANHRKANKFPDINVPGDPRTLSAIERRTPNLSTGFTTHVFGSTILEQKRATAQKKTAGAFWTQYRDELGDTYLQGGSVTGGNGGSHTFADFKVLDADTGAGSNAGKILFVEVACEATVADGIMQPGCKVITGSDWDSATTLPANDSFTVALATGSLHREIGRWAGSVFLPSGPPGNLLAAGCIGNFSITPA